MINLRYKHSKQEAQGRRDNIQSFIQHSNCVCSPWQRQPASFTGHHQLPPWIHSEESHFTSFIPSPPSLNMCPNQPVGVTQRPWNNWQCFHLWALPTLFVTKAEPDSVPGLSQSYFSTVPSQQERTRVQILGLMFSPCSSQLATWRSDTTL